MEWPAAGGLFPAGPDEGAKICSLHGSGSTRLGVLAEDGKGRPRFQVIQNGPGCVDALSYYSRKTVGTHWLSMSMPTRSPVVNPIALNWRTICWWSPTGQKTFQMGLRTVSMP